MYVSHKLFAVKAILQSVSVKIKRSLDFLFKGLADVTQQTLKKGTPMNKKIKTCMFNEKEFKKFSPKKYLGFELSYG